MPESFTQMLAISRTSLLGRMLSLDAVSADLANVNTSGYKANRINFQETLFTATLAGARPQSSQWSMLPGSLRSTGRSLDLAINGEGFFTVRLPDGSAAYTRDGQFERDAAGQLVTPEGLALAGVGPIPADAQDIHVNPDGSVMVEQNNVWAQVGQLTLSRFTNPTALLGYGQNAWVANAESGPAIAGTAGAGGFGAIAAGALEGSNVNMAREMTQLSLLQRSYSMSLRAFQQTDQMLGLAIQLRR